MEKCKWSYFKFNHYFQYTENNVFQIIGKFSYWYSEIFKKK